MKKKYLFIALTIISLTACTSFDKKEEKKSTIPNEQIVEVETSKTQANTKASDVIEKSEEKIKKKIISIDPGHALTLDKKMEKFSPKSDVLKPAYVAGTKGQIITEEKLNLILAKKLKTILEKNGFEVVMTREVSEVSISNIERAELANKSGAQLSIHIHADWSEKSTTHGISVLVPSGNYLKNPDIIEKSKVLGQDILTSTIEKTGAKNNGLSPRNDLSGFNWSDIPSIFIETGFLSNKEEELLLTNDQYQNKIAEGIYTGISKYFENN